MTKPIIATAEWPAVKRERRAADRRGKRRGQAQRRSGARLDQRPGGVRPQDRNSGGLRSFSDALLSARLGIAAKVLLFPWVVSDFSLIDAIESGIVKVPRLPVLDDAMQGELPKFRDVYIALRFAKEGAFPRKGRGKQSKSADEPSETLPHLLLPGDGSALRPLQGGFTPRGRAAPELGRPPAFIVVCNNTATSKLVDDWISGYEKTEGEGDKSRLPSFKARCRFPAMSMRTDGGCRDSARS